MPRYLLHHVHAPQDCGVAFASFNGHDSPLRHQTAIASCVFNGHAIWWDVEASSEEAARGCCLSGSPSARWRPK